MTCTEVASWKELHHSLSSLASRVCMKLPLRLPHP